MNYRIIMCLLFVSSIYSSEPPQPKTPTFKNLAHRFGSRSLIALLDSERIEGDPQFYSSTSRKYSVEAFAVSQQLIQALENKSNPIMANRWLWDFIVDKKGRTDNANKEFESYFTQQCKDFNFNPSEWYVYKFNDTLEQTKHMPMLLFIPKIEPYTSFLALLNTFSVIPPQQEEEEGKTLTRLSDGELLLGIKMTNLQKVDNPLLLEPFNVKKSPRARVGIKTPPSGDLSQYLRNMLITHTDLKNSNEDYLNQWDILVSGHGGSTAALPEGEVLHQRERMAGMVLEEFSSLLDFLNNGIRTRSFFYNSCYTGSGDIQSIFITPEKIKKDFNFLIITSNTFDAPTLGGKADFNAYFKDIDKYFSGDKNTTLAQATKHIIDWGVSYLTKKPILQIPHARFPHTQWLSVLDIDAQLFRLTNSKIMYAVNQNKDSIVIPDSTKIILLEARYTPLSLIINKEDMPLLIPLESNTNYYIKEINAPNIDLMLPEHRPLGSPSPSLTSQHFSEMFSIVQSKIKKIGMFFIEKLIIKITYQDGKISKILQSPQSKQFEFDNVTVAPQDDYIVMSYKSQKVMLERKHNTWNTTPTIQDTFESSKNSIQQESTLPEPMKEDPPRPVIEQPLLYQYLQRKDSPEELEEWRASLTEEQKEKLKMLIKQMRKTEPTELETGIKQIPKNPSGLLEVITEPEDEEGVVRRPLGDK